MRARLSPLDRPARCVLLAAAIALGAGCAAGPRPPVKVIGVTDAHARDATRMLLLFVEVQNPTGRRIELSRLDYRLEAAPWFRSEGHVPVARSVRAGGSAVIQIPIRLGDTARSAAGVAYTLEGTLRVASGTIHHRWRVHAHGQLAARGDQDGHAYVVLPTKLAQP